MTEIAEVWNVDASGERLSIKDENDLTVATICGDPLELTVWETACVMAAAPQLKAALLALTAWVENNVAYGLPQAIAAQCDHAIKLTKPELLL